MPIESKSEWEDDLDLLLQAAQAAGARAMEFFRKEPEVWWKNEGRSPVSEADIAANDILKSTLLAARPNYGWLSEETDDDPARLSCDTLFVVDPIDGTRAFITGRDLWCVSAAVVHQGHPVAGVLVAPALNEAFASRLGGPALRNGKRVRVSEPGEGGPLRLAGAEDMVARLDRATLGVIQRIPHVPSLAYRLAMVADGRIDGTLVKVNSHDWDLAAADLILTNAGGALVALDGAALTYNRPEVRHDVLCAAGNSWLGRLISASCDLADH
ncbi:3'(2'),5'-bisphosphate nucleotidase CysQ [Rhizobium sp. ARZ01]|uniref:3'(2'),5'-bisphosphate nucleotidase CysQ n=1 Tax=Rhizobium sp. ARZ01 TaxID=2769313 RepID=UPI00177C2699|nr:3'(2'),5'-bisphosphate nucleotidase CysQ [Rhizobium sp. ARZ01]MBD9371209.1 3'(2'),5'-bisphosphate nucleotidase CysQ [Rhizobium sp. ARZ01]